MRHTFAAGSQASPGAVWAVLADTQRWRQWGPSVRRVDCNERWVRPGLTGRVQTVVGLWLPFEVTEVVQGEQWAWRVAGIPATGHTVYIDAGETKVGFVVPTWALAYGPMCAVAAYRVARLAEAAQS